MTTPPEVFSIHTHGGTLEVKVVSTSERHREVIVMTFVLWLIAVVLVIAGIVSLVRGEMLWGIVLIVVGLLVGPGGVSVFA